MIPMVSKETLDLPAARAAFVDSGLTPPWTVMELIGRGADPHVYRAERVSPKQEVAHSDIPTLVELAVATDLRMGLAKPTAVASGITSTANFTH